MKRKQEKTYDPRCYDLAEVFLSEENATHAQKHALAIAIQEAIEDHLSHPFRQENAETGSTFVADERGD